MEEWTLAANAAGNTLPQSSDATEQPPVSLSGPQTQDPVLPVSETVEATRAFSERLKTMSNKKLDDFIAGMGLSDPFHADRPIQTQQEYRLWQEAARQMQANAEGSAKEAEPVDTAYAAATENSAAEAEVQRLQGELHRLQEAQRDQELLADPEQGPLYAPLRDKVQQMLEFCRGKELEVSTDTAFAAVLLRELPGLTRSAAQKAGEEALRTVQANGHASPGALGGQAASDIPDFERMSSTEFARYRHSLLQGQPG